MKSVQKAQSPPIEGALRKEMIVSTSNPHIRIDRIFSERYNISHHKSNERIGDTMTTMKQTMQQYLEYCEKERRLSENTVKAYRLDLEHFEAFLNNLQPGLSPRSISKPLLQEYISLLNEKYAVRTVKRKIASLRGFLDWAEEEELVLENPCVRM